MPSASPLRRSSPTTWSRYDRNPRRHPSYAQRLVRIFTRSAPAMPGKSGLSAAAANLVNLIASLPDDSGAATPPALPPTAPAPTAAAEAAAQAAAAAQSAQTVPGPLPAGQPTHILDQLTAALAKAKADIAIHRPLT